MSYFVLVTISVDKKEMKLLSVIKNSCMLVGVILATNMCAMDGSIVLCEQHRQKHCISRKESKFDFMNVRELNHWYYGLSDEQKKVIVDNLNDRDEVGKSRSTLFYFVTSCPEDIQRVIVAHMFKGKFKHNIKIAAEFCANTPLCNAFNVYQFSKKVFKAKDNFNKRLAKDPSFRQDIIFKYAKDIVVFDRYLNDKDRCLSKNELQSMNKVCKEFKSVRDLSVNNYKFYESFTIDNLKKHCNAEQWRALPIFLVPLILDTLPSHWDERVSHKIIEQNKVSEFINLSLKNEYEKTGNSFLLSAIKEIEDPNCFDENRWFILKGLTQVFVAGYSSFISGEATDSGTWAISGLLGYGAFAIWRMFFATGTLLERPLVGIGCVTGLYALVVALYNIKQMRTWQKATVSIKSLPWLLQRTDIELQNHY